MARGSDKYERDFIATAQAKTGHTLEEWMGVIEGASLEAKPNTILKWLKSTHGLNHAQANLLAGIYLNDGKPVFDYPVLWQRLFEGKATLLEWVQTIERDVIAALGDVEFIPTKTYISVEGKKIFACVTPTRTTLRVGLDLGSQPFDEKIQKAKGLGAMPNLTHMIEINTAGDIDPVLIDYFRQAYQQVHG